MSPWLCAGSDATREALGWLRPREALRLSQEPAK